MATLHLGEITENVVAWQKFLPTGPIALLPLTENLSSLVWSTSPEHAKQLVSMEEDRFVDAVNNAFWEDFERHPFVDQATRLSHLLASVVQPWTTSVTQSPPSVSRVEERSRAMFPYGFGHATEYVRPRLALIGDAAHRVHPLAGQGVNLGFGDVACLRDVLCEAVEEGKDIGCLEHLLTYETRRQQSVVPMITAIDILKRLYSTSSPLPVLARSMGLVATNALAPLKEEIIRFATR